MKVKVNKKIFIGIISVIVIVAIVAIMFGLVVPNIKFNQTKIRLSQINAEELQDKIIKELEKTPLNIETYTTDTTVDDEVKVGNNPDFVKVFVMTSEIELADVITIPVFKITSNEDGNFKSIEYVSNFMDFEVDVEDIIFNILKTDYNIDINYSNRQKLMEHNKNTVEIGYSSDKAFVWYTYQVNHNERYSDLDSESDIMISAFANEIEKEFKTQYFGLDL